MDGNKTVRIFGEEHKVKAQIKIMPYFSGHADQTGLMEYVTACSPDKLKDIFLVHGELERAETLRAKIMEHGYENVRIPARGDAFTL